MKSKVVEFIPSIIAASIAGVIMIAYLIISELPQKSSLQSFVKSEEGQFEYSISYEDKGNFFLVEGYGLEKGKTETVYNYGWGRTVDAAYINSKVALIDEMGNVLILPTKAVDNPEVTKVINDGVNYDYSSFLAKIHRKRIDESKKYQIGIIFTKMDNTEYLCVTDKYLENYDE